MSYDLTNKNISDTFQNLLQRTGSGNQLYDLEGNEIGDLTIAGTLHAQSYIVSQSTYIVSSGSTVFGDSNLDTHQFQGIGIKIGKLSTTATTFGYISSSHERLEGRFNRSGKSNQYLWKLSKSGSNSSAGGVLTLFGTDAESIRLDSRFNASSHFGVGKLGIGYVNVFTDLTNRLQISGSTLVEGDITASGNISASGTFYGDGSGLTGVTGEWDGTHSGTATFTGDITASGDISASGTIYAEHIQSSDDISLVDNGQILLGDGGDLSITHNSIKSIITNTTGELLFENEADNADIRFKGTDDTSTITALTLDMSEAGAATFNSDITATGLTVSGQITASGNISSSGNLHASELFIDGRSAIDSSTATTMQFGVNTTDTHFQYGKGGTALSHQFSGQITASGDISASGVGIFNRVLTTRVDHPDGTTVTFPDGINVSGGNITASGNISASGTIYSDDLIIADKVGIDGAGITSGKSLTVDGDISASGDLYIDGKYKNDLTVFGDISASGDLHLKNQKTIKWDEPGGQPISIRGIDSKFYFQSSSGMSMQRIMEVSQSFGSTFVGIGTVATNSTRVIPKELTVHGDISASGAIFADNVGVATQEFIPILPSDFHTSNDASRGHATGTSTKGGGVQAVAASSNQYVLKMIPKGYTATAGSIYGSDVTQPVVWYSSSISLGTTAQIADDVMEAASGTGSAFTDTIIGDGLTYAICEWDPSATSRVAYGGKIYIKPT